MTEIDMSSFEQQFREPTEADSCIPLEEVLEYDHDPNGSDWVDECLFGLEDLPHEDQKALVGEVFRAREIEIYYDLLTEACREYPYLDIKNRADAVILRQFLLQRIRSVELQSVVNLSRGREITVAGLEAATQSVNTPSSNGVGVLTASARALLPNTILRGTTAGIDFGPTFARNEEGATCRDKTLGLLLALTDVYRLHGNITYPMAPGEKVLIPLEQEAVKIRPTIAFVEDKK